MTSNYGNLNVGINTKPINNFDNSNENQFANFEDEDNFDDLIKGASEAENVANTNTSVTKYSNSTYTEVKKGRGRPRKERTPEEIEAELSKPIRGRGRPKKEVVESEIEPQVKKGRGRPKKELSPEEIEALANKVVRGRGRPKKEKSQEELEKAQNEIKRGRGRPKKNQLFNLFDD